MKNTNKCYKLLWGTCQPITVIQFPKDKQSYVYWKYCSFLQCSALLDYISFINKFYCKRYTCSCWALLSIIILYTSTLCKLFNAWHCGEAVKYWIKMDNFSVKITTVRNYLPQYSNVLISTMYIFDIFLKVLRIE